MWEFFLACFDKGKPTILNKITSSGIFSAFFTTSVSVCVREREIVFVRPFLTSFWMHGKKSGFKLGFEIGFIFRCERNPG